MMKQQKIFVGFVAILVIAILAGAGIFYWMSTKNSDAEKLIQEQQALENLNRTINETNGSANITVPSANPLSTASAVNPLQKTNPFNTANNEYQNPFQ